MVVGKERSPKGSGTKGKGGLVGVGLDLLEASIKVS